MSAFVVTDQHINALVRYASRHSITVYEGATNVRFTVRGHEGIAASLLLDQNVRSVNYRYDESEKATIFYNPAAPVLTAIEAIKAAQCLKYQSCETPDFDDSFSCKLLNNIISDAIPRLDGYNEAAWDIHATGVTA
jgi:hypothetical protein